MATTVSVICFLLMQINMMTYYSLWSIFGTGLILVAAVSILESFPLGGATTWLGYYGECFVGSNSLIIIVSIVLAGCTPTYVALRLWNEHFQSPVVQAIERETIAFQADEPVFLYDGREDKGRDAKRTDNKKLEPLERLPSPEPGRVSRVSRSRPSYAISGARLGSGRFSNTRARPLPSRDPFA
jgi:hypothetical protein